MDTEHYSSTEPHLDVFAPDLTKEYITARQARATRYSNDWWLCGAWLVYHKWDEWPEWVTEYGEVDRNELNEWLEDLYPNRPEMRHNPDAANVPLPLRLEVLYEQEGQCAECGVEEWRLKRRLHAHRIIPGRLGGAYVKGNIKLLCGPCHRKAPEHRRKRKT